MKSVLTLLFFLFIFNTAFADTKKHDFKGAAVAEVYKEASGDKLWIYRFDPVDYKPESDSRPAVVFFFGGGWNGGFAHAGSSPVECRWAEGGRKIF